MNLLQYKNKRSGNVYISLNLSYSESGFGIKESLNSDKHSNGESTDIIVLNNTC